MSDPWDGQERRAGVRPCMGYVSKDNYCSKVFPCVEHPVRPPPPVIENYFPTVRPETMRDLEKEAWQMMYSYFREPEDYTLIARRLFSMLEGFELADPSSLKADTGYGPTS